ncbi:arginine biosynthesis bifunctional protein ArgJ [Chthoniobacter flavus Ellin428]|uniref:Arginine biosynthesis bifunctional protein ArgJ n=1 Tax=Chthoniobacter flavus Ellin428 TaxID=497964 RepID=B4CZS9_9BACT|nr:bifunctional glutamate N-acetyltransferase/amino-acid acetyltransferase ArgJ [Chthoniobacter flavus]EDY20243.1 arginine biosynthesis bifunctional protein ArgJ [Chthoniobacter flavus Ellin428]TCO94140.1 glutamate N-acetyltransferase [Chthoniobacter flavus]
MSYTEISGGVTAAQGFLAGSVYCGIKASNANRPDIALIYSPQPTVVAGTFTTNKVKAAPVRVSMAHLRGNDVRAIVANAGNANACTGVAGIETAKRMAAATAKALKLRPRQVMVCSTGRIGVPLPIGKMVTAIAKLPEAVKNNGSRRAAEAIMTSDTFAKEIAVEFELDGKPVRIGGIAKGAGMIDPNMATMLCFISTDAAIEKKQLQEALSASVEQSFNRITVDGDMSTNDTVIILANGTAGNKSLRQGAAGMKLFQRALDHVTRNLARMIVEDGEGVTKFVEVHVNGAANLADARKAAEAVANSTLTKCAWFGGDPNWGRIMDALGYCDAKMREENVDIFYDGLIAVKGGMASKTPFSKLKKIVAQKKLTITIDLHVGSADYTVFTTDLSTDYVKLNMGE